MHGQAEDRSTTTTRATGSHTVPLTTTTARDAVLQSAVLPVRTGPLSEGHQRVRWLWHRAVSGAHPRTTHKTLLPPAMDNF